jgi:lipoyl(octanoyl) transferase
VLDDPPGPIGRGTLDQPRLVVETWLAVPADGEHRVLLLRRRPDQGGFWQGVSGCVEAHGASLRAAALREIREETGLSCEIPLFDLGLWFTFRGFAGTHYRKRSLGAVLPREVCPATVVLSDEHEEVALVTFDEARARVRWKENLEELQAFRAALTRI